MSEAESLRVLIIEDDADARSNLADILELADWTVDAVGSARAALARDGWERYTAILLDRRLPDADGVDLLRKLKHRAPAASVIMITGLLDLDGAIAALRQGAADYILKPINPDALRASLDRVAEQRRSAEALRRGELRMRAIFENTLDGLLIVDAEGRLVEANPAARSIFHCTGEPLDHSLLDLMHLADVQSSAEALGRILQTGKQLMQGRVRCPDGSRVDIEYQAVGDFLPGLNLISVRDITARKAAEQRALQSERLAAIGETMAGLVHEGRNALQRSKACLEMLVMEVENQPEALDLIKRVQKAQDDLHRLYEEVRQYAAPINLDRDACNLAALWREIWGELAHARAGREITLREELATDPICFADYFALGQVIRNIFENAIQASPAGSTVTVSCADARLEDRPAVRIGIRDTGLGMTRELRLRIFEPFFTTKSKGTGLGMAISKRIVESHGGTIEAVDRDGPGAEITLLLPRSAS